MEELLLFTYAEALDIAKSKAHLKGTTFIKTKSNHIYAVYMIIPVPANIDEQDELRDLLSTMLETNDRLM